MIEVIYHIPGVIYHAGKSKQTKINSLTIFPMRNVCRGSGIRESLFFSLSRKRKKYYFVSLVSVPLYEVAVTVSIYLRLWAVVNSLAVKRPVPAVISAITGKNDIVK